MYQVQRTARSERVPIRGLPYHVQIWGEPGSGKIPLVMVHGWMDVAASYQFVVDALQHDHYIIAPDWRGFGQTPSTAAPGTCADNFWFPDYMADLDFLLDHYAPNQAVNLVGHSLGGNVVLLYAGVRPERVHRLVNLEGFGMPATQPTQAPKRYATWMDELKKLHRGEMDLKPYDSSAGVARRLMKTNRRLSQDKAEWLAQHWAQPNAQGQWSILGEPGHKITGANLFRLDEVLALYQSATMPVLCVEASDDSLGQWWKGKFTREEYHARIQCIAQLEIAVIQDAGHMMHHDQPQALAALIERFIQ
ncbi:MAG: alpha/beta hydrolase [Burkholderiales bacterium]|nr:alpha/beta hydrolase [Burkholderiales bacterium]